MRTTIKSMTLCGQASVRKRDRLQKEMICRREGVFLLYNIIMMYIIYYVIVRKRDRLQKEMICPPSIL